MDMASTSLHMKGETLHTLEDLMNELEEQGVVMEEFKPRRPPPPSTTRSYLRMLFFNPRRLLRSYQMFGWVPKPKCFKIERQPIMEGELVIGYINFLKFSDFRDIPSIQSFLNKLALAVHNQVSVPRLLCALRELQEMENKDEDLMELQQFLEMVQEEELAVLDEMIAHGEIIFDGLWRAFPAGGRLVTTDDEGELRGAFLKSSGYRHRIFEIHTSSISTNGTSFAPITKETSILSFDGLKEFTTLRLRPPTDEEYTRLYQRGQMFKKVALGFHYKSYRGFMTYHSDWIHEKFDATGRVMVDPGNFSRFNPNYSFCDYQPHLEKQDPIEQIQQASRKMKKSLYTNNERQRKPQRNQNNQPSPLSAGNLDIKEEEIFSCVPTIAAFSFLRKRWGFIRIESLSEVVFDRDSFDRIVMEDTRKKFIKSLLERSGEGFTDIISGKGGGSVLLLYGPPGTGKTLTAEATAELLEKPLYSISVGELGIRPLDLEQRLRQIMEVTREWNAVVLIDEADIFMEKRSTTEIKRNAMVGIFLRLLEYNQSVLFLTSNRVSSFDDAFRSRISAALHFEILVPQSRKQVFQNLCSAAGIPEAEMDFDELAKHELNGRQIRSTVRLALSLAITENCPVRMEHFVKAINFALQFEMDLKGMEQASFHL